jgi:ribonuclease BN (tRNA processing enzyme)
MLWDCGEGTYAQLSDKFKDNHQLDEELAKIKIVFISHYHEDHCMGTLILLKRISELRYKNLNKKHNKK